MIDSKLSVVGSQIDQILSESGHKMKQQDTISYDNDISDVDEHLAKAANSQKMVELEPNIEKQIKKVTRPSIGATSTASSTRRYDGTLAPFVLPTEYKKKVQRPCLIVFVIVVVGAIAGAIFAFSNIPDPPPAEEEPEVTDPVNMTLNVFEDSDELMTAVDLYVNYTPAFNLSKYGNNITEWDVSAISDFSMMFSTMRNPDMIKFDADISIWNTANATNMSMMFEGAESFDSTLSEWNVTGVKDFSRMFMGARNFSGIGVETWSTISATNMDDMFAHTQMFNADLKGWTISNVTSMIGMFANSESFRGYGLQAWSVSDIVNTTGMLCNATGFNPIILFTKWIGDDEFC